MRFVWYITGAALLLSGFMLVPRKETEVTIGFTGDVMIGRLLNEKIRQAGYTYPWGNMRSVLHNNDLNIANLETTLTTSTDKVPKVFNYKAGPTHVQALKEANIGLVSLANNHSLDFGPSGLRETIDTLDGAGILHVGAGENAAKAHKPVIVERGGIRIGVLGYTDNEPGWKATADAPGIAYVHVSDIDALRDDVVALRTQVDLLVVSLHIGPNMVTEPSRAIVDFCHGLVDLGVDIIHGHSAHVVQGMELYKGKLIMYNTGDFVDDYAVDAVLRNDLSFLFLISATKSGVQTVRLVPVRIKNMQVNRAEGDDASTVIKMMQERSQAFGMQLLQVNGELRGQI